MTIVLLAIAGCQESGKKELLTVKFAPETTLRYRMVSKRNVVMDLKITPRNAARKSKPLRMSENLNLVMAYKTIESNPDGLSTIEATCESVKARRRYFGGSTSSSDPIENLVGKSFTFQITPAGEVADDSNLEELVREVGETAFVEDTGDDIRSRMKREKRGDVRSKNMDMILDFVFLHSQLWDSIAGIEKPLDGVNVGKSWQRTQFTPLTVMTTPGTKLTTYTLSDVMDAPDGRRAMIDIDCALNDEQIQEWLKPYDPPYTIRGLAGDLTNYYIKELDGSGRAVFNLDRGVLESERQEYLSLMEVNIVTGMGAKRPMVTVEQKINMKLLAD